MEEAFCETLLEVPQGRISWEGWGDADADGNFRIVSPMANGILGKGFRTEPRTRVLRQHGVTEVEVPEAAVREGHSIEIEDLPTP